MTNMYEELKKLVREYAEHLLTAEEVDQTAQAMENVYNRSTKQLVEETNDVMNEL